MTAADRLDKIQARADAATDGPWSSHAFGYSGDGEPSSIVVHHGKFNWQAVRDGEFVASMPRWDAQESDDAVFIAHARTDVPALVAAVRAVLDVCENYPVPPSDEDVTGAVLAGMEKLERLIRAAIHESLGEVAS